MAQFIYAPILKWKKGEIKALENLSQEDRNKVYPIIHFFLPQNEVTFLEEINKLFGDRNEIFIPYLDYKRGFPTNIVPILEIDNFQNYSGKKAIIVRENDIERTVLNDNDIYDLYIILDIFKLYETNIIGYKKYLVNTFINNNIELLKMERVKGLIICSTSFPDTEISNSLSTNTVEEYSKFEIDLFNQILVENAFLGNKLIFSDYGTTRFTNDTPEGENFFFSNAADKIKYSTRDKYIFMKGKKDVKNYVELAKELIRHPDFLYDFYSFGNEEIKKKATGNNGVGNHMNWVTYCCNHHIVLVLRQLEQLFGL